MAKTNITQYSSTPSSNTDINSINIDENCPASGLNNAIRELMAHLKNVDTGSQALTALSVTGDTTISSGNLLVGKTSSAFGTGGIEIRGSDDASYFTRSGNAPVHINRLSSDGEILRLNKDSGLIASIGYESSGFYIDGEANHSGLSFQAPNVTPRYNGSLTDDFVHLGSTSNRFKNLYLSGGVYLGGTGAANELDDYEEGTWTPAFRNDGSTTYDHQVGRYVKIGQLVIAAAHLDVSTNNIGTNAIQVETLPFTSINDNANAFGSSSSLHCNNWNGSNKPDHFIIAPNSTFASGYGSAGQAGLAFPNGNDLGGGNLIVTFIYRTA